MTESGFSADDVRQHLEAVAETYLAALDCGDAPNNAVVAKWNVSTSQASRWVRQARVEGLLDSDLDRKGQVNRDPRARRLRPRGACSEANWDLDAWCLQQSGAGRTLTEIGKELGVSRERVRQRVARAKADHIDGGMSG